MMEHVDHVDFEIKATLHADVRDGRGIDRVGFERLNEMFGSGTNWASMDQVWTRKVVYRMADECRLSCVYDGHVHCYKHEVHDSAVLRNATGGAFAVVRRCSRPDRVPPPRDVRYRDVKVEMSRRFVKASAGMQGIRWAFDLTVRWHGACLRDLQSAPPRYLVSVVLVREWSDPSVSIAAAGVPRWLAESLLMKLGDLVSHALSRTPSWRLEDGVAIASAALPDSNRPPGPDEDGHDGFYDEETGEGAEETVADYGFGGAEADDD